MGRPAVLEVVGRQGIAKTQGASPAEEAVSPQAPPDRMSVVVLSADGPGNGWGPTVKEHRLPSPTSVDAALPSPGSPIPGTLASACERSLVVVVCRAHAGPGLRRGSQT